MAERSELNTLHGWRRLDLLVVLSLAPLCFFAIAPLVSGPMFASADGLYHLYRLVEFDQALRSGVWYPRWAPDLMAGYGYPIFVFYAPLQFYLGALAHALGLGYVDATKAVVAAGIFASAFGMYVLGRDWWGRLGGLVAAVSYVYFPYRMVNTYLDGEVSQTLAWAWLPWLTWASWRALTAPEDSPAIGFAGWRVRLRLGRRTRYAAVAGLCYAGLFFTHSLMSWLSTLVLALLLLGFWCLRLARFGDLLRLAAFYVFGVAAAAIYWLPALAEQGAIQIGRARTGTWDFHANFVPLARTISLDWAHQYQGYVGVNGPSQLGTAQAIVALAGLVAVLLLALTVQTRGPQTRFAVLLAILSIVFFALMLRLAAPFWERVPFGQYLQFPDRMLAPLAFTLALLSGGLGCAFKRLPEPAGLALAGCTVALLIFGGVAQLHVDHIALPERLAPGDAVEYEQMTGASGSALGEFAPIAVGPPPVSSPLVLAYLRGQPPQRVRATPGPVSQVRQTPTDIRFHSSLAGPGSATLMTAYYPGWTATVNGKIVPVKPDESGLISFSLPAGEAEVDVHFEATPDRQAGGLISAIGLVGLLFFLWASRANRGVSSKRPNRNLVGAGLKPARRWRKGNSANVEERGQVINLPLQGPGTSVSFSWSLLCFLLLAVLAAGSYAFFGLHGPRKSPATQPMDITYANGVQLLGSDVQVDAASVRTVVYLRTDRTPASDLRVKVAVTTLSVPWASGQLVLHPSDLTGTAKPFDIDYIATWRDACRQLPP